MKKNRGEFHSFRKRKPKKNGIKKPKIGIKNGGQKPSTKG
jgi:hypothetical protein